MAGACEEYSFSFLPVVKQLLKKQATFIVSKGKQRQYLLTGGDE